MLRAPHSWAKNQSGVTTFFSRSSHFPPLCGVAKHKQSKPVSALHFRSNRRHPGRPLGPVSTPCHVSVAIFPRQMEAGVEGLNVRSVAPQTGQGDPVGKVSKGWLPLWRQEFPGHPAAPLAVGPCCGSCRLACSEEASIQGPGRRPPNTTHAVCQPRPAFQWLRLSDTRSYSLPSDPV